MNDDTIYEYTGITKFNLTNGKTLRTGTLGNVRATYKSSEAVQQIYFHTEDAIWPINFMEYEEPEIKTKELDSISTIKENTYVLIKNTGHIGRVVGINEKRMLCVSSDHKHNYYEPSELLVYLKPTIWEEIRYFFTNK